MDAVHVVDSHTEGEPTRVVVGGGPDLGDGSMADRRERFRREHDRFRRALVNEPRGSEVTVGALLCPPPQPPDAAGVVFFNNVGYLGMCVHGTIGLVATLAHLGRVEPGRHTIDTPVGKVGTELHPNGAVTVRNVASHRSRAGVEVAVPGYAPVTGDVAWGGNWFFLVEGAPSPLSLAHAGELTAYASAIREGLEAAHVVGDGGAPIDHIELFGPPRHSGNDSRNFVLCPGGVYDRSPCGTGTCAKLACLFADGKLREGETWRQEGIVGTVFEGAFEVEGGRCQPRITGRAHITAEADLVLDPRDPFCYGFPGDSPGAISDSDGGSSPR
jgi:4-hydroxyproline epimerase